MSIGRRRGRILAFQAVYAWELGYTALDDLTQFFWFTQKDDDEESSPICHEADFIFPKMMVLGTIENIEVIDACIKRYLQNWDFSRITNVDKALLRISTYSLLFQKDTAPSVVIDEAINIAKDFGSDDSFKFVNAILDSIRKTE